MEQHKRRIKVTIIIPVYNEKNTINTVIDSVTKLSVKGIRFEVIIIDDGSTDGTKQQLERFIFPLNNSFKRIYHETNKGKGQAIKTGIDNASGEYILIQDADLEYDPKYIPVLLKPLIEGNAEVVYGTRLNRLPNIFKEEKKPLFLFHYIGNRMLSLIVSILYGQWITDIETGYKIFPKKALDSERLDSQGFEIESEITAKLLKGGHRIVEVPITTIPRGYDKGKKLHTIRDGKKALWSIIKYRFYN